MTDPSREVQAIWDAAEKRANHRAVDMPTEQDAINAMWQAYQRLKELGWREAIYCPKDGTVFDAIEAGSTGIHPCHYEGDWPKGFWWLHEANDLWPGRPVLFKERAK